MALQRIKDYLKHSPRGKRAAHRALFPKDDFRPRWWVRNVLNPLAHSRKGIIRSSARLDTVPFNAFELGERAIVESRCLINNAMGDVRIGRGTLVGYSSVIIGPVTIDEDVLIAQHVAISALNHNYEDVTRPISAQGVNVAPIHVKAGAWIAANAIVLAGVTIGRNAVVAAGAVVTKDVPDFSVVVGSPARVVRQYDVVSGAYARPEPPVGD